MWKEEIIWKGSGSKGKRELNWKGKGVKIVGEEKQLGKNEGKENCERGKGKIKIKGRRGGKFKKKLLKA